MSALIDIDNLSVSYQIGSSLFGARQKIEVLSDISLQIKKGQFFGLVGESGSGKSTLGKALLQAAPISGGRITSHITDTPLEVASLKGQALKDYRKSAQMIFQDPYSSLNPRMTIRDIIAEPLEVMGLAQSREETDQKVREIARQCRLNLEHLRRFPHAFSGGQRQRIAIARALVSEPELIIADESVAALDVSTQADILNLLKSIQSSKGLTFFFISHDLSVVAHVCDVVAVMYLGQIVEIAPKKSLFAMPRHPYTKALLASVPSLDLDQKLEPNLIEGEIPSVAAPPEGCRIHTRCPHATALCISTPPMMQQDEAGHSVACHHWATLPA
ncbi:MAG: peptide ABC transporter ATP-binding protein [SAR116 cluster bacterium MED-G04]|jgi:peptide/nickel transport system ATP-binding protein|nr:peptide ABC transporter ATP-binding protein [SAR116 cluster bacterium]OUW37017.1 MAG: peptide ABC transporter ATP-binding protein [Gammaproteobacteria bacterium TMED183]PDH66710.1 MAG: peptide ABC transporter ATP-binding protein [SAR116 cluster bacterium MED-G04]HCD49444.1 peptide ABC transporter ATP-binding protein [Alphaproteobacteria bacterium]|tara:strand:- start:184 stop:1173 length:990 start_codon:yes stop_codon:yes gene_type:complete